MFTSIRLVFAPHDEEGPAANEFLSRFGCDGWYYRTSTRPIERKCSDEFYQTWRPYFGRVNGGYCLTVRVSVKRCTPDHVRIVEGFPRLLAFRQDMLASQFLSLAKKSLVNRSNYGLIEPSKVLIGKDLNR